MQQSVKFPGASARHRLESWKEIAAYLKRDIRTVQRWEKYEALPVHRHQHARGATVYAFPDELDEWGWQRQPAAGGNGTARRTWGWVALAVVLAVGAGMAAWRLAVPRDVPAPATRRVWLTPDADHLGSVSQDGKRLCFQDGETADLAVMETGGQTARRLTRKPPLSRIGGAFWPVFSRDGKWIAYTWDLASDVELRVIGTDGGRERALVRDATLLRIRALDVSPDNQRILALAQSRDGHKRLVVVDSASGAMQTVVEVGYNNPLHGGFSPDGEWIAYDLAANAADGERDIFLHRLRDGRPTALVRHSGHDWFWGWAPNGQILYGCDRTGSVDAWTVAVTHGVAGEAKLAKSNVGPIRPMNFTQSGSYYFGIRSRLNDVMVAGLNSKTGMPEGKAASASDQHVGENLSPDWSPDGKWLAYLRHPPAFGVEIRPRVIIRPAEGGAGRELAPALVTIEMLRWTGDGRGFLATAADEKEQTGVFRIDASSGAVTAVVADKSSPWTYHEPLVTADGRRIFYKRRQGAAEPAPLMVRDVASGKETQFLPSVYRLSLSPDGNKLAYCTFDEQHERIAVIPIGGGKPVELARMPREGRIVSVAWSADGHWVLFARRGMLWRIPVAGGAPEKVPLQAEAMRELRVNPRGNQIAFTAGSTARGEVWVMENLLAR